MVDKWGIPFKKTSFSKDTSILLIKTDQFRLRNV